MTTTISPADVIAQITYKDGWWLFVADRAGDPCLIIDHPNGYAQIPLPLVALRYMHPLPGHVARRVALWVFEQISAIEKRQAEAAFTYAGQRIGEIEGP